MFIAYLSLSEIKTLSSHLYFAMTCHNASASSYSSLKSWCVHFHDKPNSFGGDSEKFTIWLASAYSAISKLNSTEFVASTAISMFLSPAKTLDLISFSVATGTSSAN
jgi:hypothetical protein